jgi:Spy/CpxP family protein refolding chaperone
MMGKNGRRCGAFLMAICGLALLAPAAQAQERRMITARTMMGGGSMTAPISKRSLERWTDILSLNDEQKDALAALHTAYQSTHQEAAKEFNDVLQEANRAFQETQDFEALNEKTPAARKKFTEKTKASEKSFLADARSLLTPEQEANWYKIERMRRRETGARMSVMSGDGLDLSDIVAGLKVPQDSALAQALEEYETEADRAMQERLRISENAPASEPGRPINIEDFQKQIAENREVGLKLKDINQRHARKIEPMLPEEKQPAFRDAVKHQTYPQVYRPTLASRWLDSSLKMSDLTTEQRNELSELRAQYERDLRTANDAWAAAVEKNEADPSKGGGISGGPGGMMMINMGDDDPALAAAKKARRELDDRTREKIKSVLTPEQRENLPKPEDEGMIGPGGSRIQIRGG